jgi:hypothetical protein
MITKRKYDNAVLKAHKLLEIHGSEDELIQCYSECCPIQCILNNSNKRKKIGGMLLYDLPTAETQL